MKLKAGELYAAMSAARALAAEKLPVKAKYWLGRLIDRMEPEFKAIEKSRTELLLKHGTLNEDGVTVKLSKEQAHAFGKEFEAEILGNEIEIDAITIKLEVFGDGDIQSDLTALQKFIEAP